MASALQLNQSPPPLSAEVKLLKLNTMIVLLDFSLLKLISFQATPGMYQTHSFYRLLVLILGGWYLSSLSGF